MAPKYSFFGIDQFETAIDGMKLGAMQKFPNSENGRKVPIFCENDCPIKLQPVTRSDALKCPFGISDFTNEKGEVRWSCTVVTPLYGRVHDVLKKFDNKILEEGKKHPEWFREAGWKAKAINDNTIEGNFGSTLKEPEPDKKTGEIKYPEYQWKITLQPNFIRIFEQNESTGVLELLKDNPHLQFKNKRCECVPVVNLGYIWFTGSQWGIKWYLDRLVITKVMSGWDETDISDMIGMDDVVVTINERKSNYSNAPDLAKIPGGLAAMEESLNECKDSPKKRIIKPAMDIDDVLLH